MFNSNQTTLKTALRTMQIITLALIVGVLSFFGVAIVVVWNQPGVRGGDPVISYVALAMFVTNTPLALVVPQAVTQAGLKKIALETRGADPTHRLLGLRQASLTIGLALLEACAFLAGVGYFVEAEPLALGI